jgi:hypothetical protein
MNLSDKITVTEGFYENERRIRFKNTRDPHKNISLSSNEWCLLMMIIEEINEHVSILRQNRSTPEKTWDPLIDGSGNKRVSAKRFSSGTIIVDFRIFNFHVQTPLPTIYGISLNEEEWDAFMIQHHKFNSDWTKHEKMRSIIKEILREMVICKTKENCHGCLTDHPSQKEHMELGCLSPWQEQKSAYMEECYHTISPNNVLEKYIEVTGDSNSPWKLLKCAFEDKDFKDQCFQISE